MTCEECEEILLDSDSCAGRKGWMWGVSVLNLANLHAKNCSACAAKMSEISRMNAFLDQMRLSTVQTEVPATIEANLLVEYRQRRALRAPSVPNTFRWRLVWGSAIALALVVALVSYSVLRTRSSITAQTGRTERSAQQPPSPLHSGASRDRALIENHQTGADRPELASSRREPRTKPGKRARTESSLPVKDELSLNGGGNVVRVTLPLASLVAMGVPMYPEVSNRRITADVARDPFGAVIAIHLVETRPSTN